MSPGCVTRRRGAAAVELTTNRPNLFHFATSELSQDAFLCWLIDHARYPEQGALAACARDFLAFLYGRARPEEQVRGQAVALLDAPERQWNDIDIIFKADVGGRTVTFVIEDKVDTSHHSGQLERYRKVLEQDGVAASDMVLIYLKTGFMFGEDRAAAHHGYAVIGPDDLVGFLDAEQYRDIRSDIFTDFRDHMRARVESTRDGLPALLRSENPWAFENAHVQWEFMAQTVLGGAGEGENGELRRGRNVGGSPWTQYRFVALHDVLPDEIREDLFYRLDGRKNPFTGQWGYYLAVRQYAWVKQSPEARRIKLQRLERYRRAFAEAHFESRSTLVTARPTTDNQGANESEIGTVFFDSETNKVSDVLREWPALHHAFLARLRAEGLVPPESSTSSEELAVQP
jgi:hypothetical protein